MQWEKIIIEKIIFKKLNKCSFQFIYTLAGNNVAVYSILLIWNVQYSENLYPLDFVSGH